MNSINNLGVTILKAILFSTLLFWTILFSEDFEFDMFILIFISIIPISIISSITIFFTITPFFWMNKKERSNNEIFKRYFPYYAISLFCFCSLLISSFGFSLIACAFFTTSFFTLMQSWIWLSTPSSKKNLK